MSGGRDHLTHRLASRLGAPERVAGALALGQTAIVVVTVVASQRSAGWTGFVAATCVALGLAAIWALEQPQWFPLGRQSDAGDAAAPALGSVHT